MVPVSGETIEDCETKQSAWGTLSGVFCNATFDGILCWPATPSGLTARNHCPKIRAFDSSKFATRKCGSDGVWLSKDSTDGGGKGWTNFTECYTPEGRTLYMNLYGNKTEDEREAIQSVLRTIRALEVSGSCVSLVALIISVSIFCCVRSLRCERTKIHVNLFTAMALYVVVRLLIYIDQAMAHSLHYVTTVFLSPIVCEMMYTLMEYSNSCVFMWMFLEGFHLNSTLTDFPTEKNIRHYVFIGWGVPMLCTSLWALTQGFLYQGSPHNCWYGYTTSPFYWIVEGPRVVIILINFALLLNIVRILYTKLRNSRLTEAEQARKAIKAAFVLLPLLGLTHIVCTVETAAMTKVKFESSAPLAAWMFSSCLLTDFQGFYLSVLYCFQNGEVRNVLNRKIAQLSYQRLSINFTSHTSAATRRVPQSSVNALKQEESSESQL